MAWRAGTEQFFRLDTEALELARAQRGPATRLGWAVQWGTMRMLGTFPTEDRTAPSMAVDRGAPATVRRGLGELAGVELSEQRRGRGRIAAQLATGRRVLGGREDLVYGRVFARRGSVGCPAEDCLV